MSPRRPRVYGLVRAWARALLYGFYRIEIAGPPLPKDVPLLLIANHQNGLADGALLLLSTERPLRVLVKYGLLSMPLIGALLRALGALPVYRQKDGVDRSQNQAAFQAVHAALAQRSVIALFPEGSSHSEPRLAELKTGVARLALGSLAEHGPGLELTILPIGLWYEARDRFGSRVRVERGQPIDARPFLTPGGAEDRQAVGRLMEHLRLELERLSAALPAGLERAHLEAAVQRLGVQPGHEFGLRQRLATRLRLRALQGGARWSRLSRRLQALPARLILAGPSLRARWIWWPPGWLCAAIATRLRPTPDKHVTTLLLAATLLFPLWWLALLGLGARLGAPGWIAAALLPALAARGRFRFRQGRPSEGLSPASGRSSNS
jgi:1-acyl-sn-glycerol-3-phosphate acyltransferase